VASPTNTDHARFRHVVELGGLCREKLGDFRFRAAHLAGRGSQGRRPLQARVPPLRREVVLLVVAKIPAQGEGNDGHGGHGGHGGRYHEADVH
jgi:hypothetical protein